MKEGEAWMAEGLCRKDNDPAYSDMWFQNHGARATVMAQDICTTCPVMLECLRFAREEGIPEGVFGGEHEREREMYWESHGGRPTAFSESIYSHTDHARIGSHEMNSRELPDVGEVPEEVEYCGNGLHIRTAENSRKDANRSGTTCIPCKRDNDNRRRATRDYSAEHARRMARREALKQAS